MIGDVHARVGLLEGAADALYAAGVQMRLSVLVTSMGRVEGNCRVL